MGSKGRKQIKLTSEQREEILRLRREGNSLTAVVEQTGISLSTIRWQLAKAGVRVDKNTHVKNMRGSHNKQVEQRLAVHGVPTWDDVVNKLVTEKGGRALSGFINARSPIRVECNKGHLWSAKFSNLQQGGWCPECAHRSRTLTDEEIFSRAAQWGATYLPGYKDDEKRQFICANDHSFVAEPHYMKKRLGCAKCAGNAPLTLEDIQRKIAKKDGWKLISWEADSKTIKVECPEGHQTQKLVTNFLYSGCSICAGGCHASKEEVEILEFVRSLLPGMEVRNDRVEIAPFELDIYIPDKKLAIEYCGLYWHGENHNEGGARLKHLDKLQRCEARGIQLVTIFADEWMSRRPQVEGYLRAILGCPAERVGARECELEEIETSLLEKFMDDNHIQGHSFATVGFELTYNGEIVAAALFKKRPREGEWDLNRYCVKAGYAIPGGLQRILKKFVASHQPRVLLSFSDKRWSQGHLYRSTGFTHDNSLLPSYWYFRHNDESVRIHKFNFRRKKLISMGANPDLTEWPMAQSLGLDRIWDCGLDKWVLRYTQV